MVTHLFRTHTRFPQTSWSAIRCVCVFCYFVSAGCAGSHHSRHCKVEMMSACLVWQRSCQKIHCRCVISYRHRLLNFDLINPLSDPPSLRILEPCWWCSPGIILSSEWEWQPARAACCNNIHSDHRKPTWPYIAGEEAHGRMSDVLHLFAVSTCLQHCTLAGHHNFHHLYLSSSQGHDVTYIQCFKITVKQRKQIQLP